MYLLEAAVRSQGQNHDFPVLILTVNTLDFPWALGRLVVTDGVGCFQSLECFVLWADRFVAYQRLDFMRNILLQPGKKFTYQVGCSLTAHRFLSWSQSSPIQDSNSRHPWIRLDFTPVLYVGKLPVGVPNNSSSSRLPRNVPEAYPDLASGRLDWQAAVVHYIASS